jgi:hypothetical protein
MRASLIGRLRSSSFRLCPSCREPPQAARHVGREPAENHAVRLATECRADGGAFKRHRDTSLRSRNAVAGRAVRAPAGPSSPWNDFGRGSLRSMYETVPRMPGRVTRWFHPRNSGSAPASARPWRGSRAIRTAGKPGSGWPRDGFDAPKHSRTRPWRHDPLLPNIRILRRPGPPGTRPPLLNRSHPTRRHSGMARKRRSNRCPC